MNYLQLTPIVQRFAVVVDGLQIVQTQLWVIIGLLVLAVVELWSRPR